MHKTEFKLPPMPPRAREIILTVAEERGIALELLAGRCRLSPVFRARAEAAKRLDALSYSTPQIGKFLNCDHTTIVFYLGRGRKQMSPERPPRPPRKRKWKAPKVRHLRWLALKTKPVTHSFRYAGYDPTENQITPKPQQEHRA